MTLLIDGVTPLPENGDTGWGTVLNAAINAIDNRFVWASGQAVASKAAASGITGTTLASNVVSSSLTSVGTLTSLAVSGAITIGGDLTVNGTTTTINTATLSVSDNIVILNSDVAGSPTENAGIEVERGTSTNVSVRWNETTDLWEFTTDGSTYNAFNAAASITGATLAANVLSSSLTSVGTISSGTWQGSVVAGQYGGTGVANTGKTITLGGNLTTSGAYAVTFTVDATTSLTLPASGTVATLAGSESLTNKKLGSLTSNGIVTTSAGDGTLGITSTTGSGNVVLATSPQVTTSLTTDSSTFSLVNSTATTVNFAGAATALSIGAATGTTTINNGLTVAGTTVLGPSSIAQQSSDYTLVLADQGTLIEMTNSSDATVTIPPNTTAFPIGAQITVIRNGSGKVLFAAGAGVAIYSDSSKLYLSTQYSAGTLIKRATNTWYLIGNLSAS